jgi:hypothetical protein
MYVCDVSTLWALLFLFLDLDFVCCLGLLMGSVSLLLSECE